MRKMRYGLGVEDIVAREAALARRAEVLRMIAVMTGATGAVALAVASLASRDLVTTLVAASPTAVALLAGVGELVTRRELGRVKLLLAVLTGAPRAGRAPPRAAARTREPPRVAVRARPAGRSEEHVS